MRPVAQCNGNKVTFDITNMDTGIPAIAGHYSTSELLGFDPPPGVAFQVQVAFRPSKELPFERLTLLGRPR